MFHPRKKIVKWPLLATALPILVAAYPPGERGAVIGIVLLLALLGLGFGLFSSPNTNAIMGAVSPDLFGVAGAMAGTMRQLGMMLSMAVVMLLLGLHLGNAEISPANAGDFLSALRMVFAVFSVLCVVGIFASLARGRVEPDEYNAGDQPTD